MSCCCPHSRSAGRLFSFFARRYRQRFNRRGFEPSQQQLLDGLQQAGFADASLLEIGSGVGHLHLTLLERGAASATGIDLAPSMIEEAQRWAEERGLAERTRYQVADFMDMDDIEAADITILDKVICCYPDAEGLTGRSLANTRRLWAVTYPRRTWYTRLGEKLGAALMWLLRSDFRPYVHDPVHIEAWAGQAGFDKSFEKQTFIWLTQIYSHNGEKT